MASELNIVHASTVCTGRGAAMIIGSSGSGKSHLALNLIAYGAKLVSDDRTILTTDDKQVIVKPVQSIAGKIEARGIGILSCEFVESAPLIVVVNLDEDETERLPTRRTINYFGYDVDLIRARNNLDIAPALVQFLHAGREQSANFDKQVQ